MNIDTFVSKLNSLEPQSILNFEDDFREFVKDFDVREILAKELRDCLADHKRLPRIVSPTALSLASGKWFSIDLISYGDQDSSGTIVTHVVDSLNYVLLPAEFSLFSLIDYDNSAYSNATTVKLEKEGVLMPGELVAIDRNKNILNLKSNSTALVISISNTSLYPYAWKFNSVSGAPICYFNTRPLATVLELMSKFLGAYGGEESVDCLRTLLVHESDTIKWHAANALARIDRDEGINAFSRLTTCRNSMISAAAIATLAHSKEAA